MVSDLVCARDLLLQGGFTCVLRRGEVLFTDTRRGIRPLLELLDNGTDLRGFSAADKVVGRATALLYRLLGVKALYAGVISQAALDVLEGSGIALQWQEKVPYIINRAGDGQCPMEAATAQIDDPRAALEAIRQTLKALQSH